MKAIRKIISGVLVCCILAVSLPIHALAASVTVSAPEQTPMGLASQSGRCGEQLTWQYQGHTLTIAGTGAMTDWAGRADTPWAALSEEIRQVVIKQGVTSIGSYAFSGCANLQRVYLPLSVTKIGTKGLNNCEVNSKGGFAIYYEGRIPNDWAKIKTVGTGENASISPRGIGTGQSYSLPPLTFEDASDPAPSENADLSTRIVGTWSNQASIPETASFSSRYDTTFSADGRVAQAGWRNRDAGTYHIVNATTVTATFTYNLFDAPGYGYEQIDGYSYTVTYTYNAENDTLYADYSEELADSNATDGTLRRMGTAGTMPDWVPETMPPVDAADGPSPEQIAHFKQALGVPDSLDVEISVSDRYYWSAGTRWLIQVSFTRDGEIVAGAAFDADTLEIVRDILMYSGNADGPSAWAAAEVQAARKDNLIPEELDADYRTDITRAEFCALVWALQQSLLGEDPAALLDQHDADLLLDAFSDVDRLSEYAEQIASANRQGIVNGYGNGRFGPDGAITRAEAAAMLMRTARSLGMKQPNGSQMTFSDTAALQQWAKDGIRFISACVADGKAVMGGTGTATFSPNANYTREQAFITFERLYRCFDDRQATFCFREEPTVTTALNYANSHYPQLDVFDQGLQDAAQEYVDRGLVYVNGMWDVLDAVKDLAKLDIDDYAEVVTKNDYNLIITQLMLSNDFYQGLTDVISENTLDKLNQIYTALCAENPEYATLLGAMTDCKSLDALLSSNAYQTLKHEISKDDPPLLENLFSEVFGEAAGTVYNTISDATAVTADAIEASAILLAYQDADAAFYQMMLLFRSYIRSNYAQDADIKNLQSAIDELVQGYVQSQDSQAFIQEFASTFAQSGVKTAIASLPGKLIDAVPQVAALQKVAGISFDVGMWMDDVLFSSSETAYYGNLIPKIASVASIAAEFSENCKQDLYNDRSAENAAMFEQASRMYYNLIALGHEAIIRYCDARNINAGEWNQSLDRLTSYQYD